MSNPQILSKVIWRLRFAPVGTGAVANPVDAIPNLEAGAIAAVPPQNPLDGPLADVAHAGEVPEGQLHTDDPTVDADTDTSDDKFGPLTHGDKFRINFNSDSPGIEFLQAADNRTSAVWNSATEIQYDATIPALRLSLRHTDDGIPGIGTNLATYQFSYRKTTTNGLHILSLEEVREEEKALSLSAFITRPVAVHHDGAWHADDTGTTV